MGTDLTGWFWGSSNGSQIALEIAKDVRDQESSKADTSFK